MSNPRIERFFRKLRDLKRLAFTRNWMIVTDRHSSFTLVVEEDEEDTYRRLAQEAALIEFQSGLDEIVKQVVTTDITSGESPKDRRKRM